MLFAPSFAHIYGQHDRELAEWLLERPSGMNREERPPPAEPSLIPDLDAAIIEPRTRCPGVAGQIVAVRRAGWRSGDDLAARPRREEA